MDYYARSRAERPKQDGGAQICPFYTRTGACRHGDSCSRIHELPVSSPTILIKHIYRRPIGEVALQATREVRRGDGAGRGLTGDNDGMDGFLAFFEDFFQELSKFGNLEALHVCENLSQHINGHVYAKFSRGIDAARAIFVLNGRYYDGRRMEVELSPVVDFGQARCRDFDSGTCRRGRYCNYLHIKPAPQCLIDDMILEKEEEAEEKRCKEEMELRERRWKEGNKRRRLEREREEERRRLEIEREIEHRRLEKEGLKRWRKACTKMVPVTLFNNDILLCILPFLGCKDLVNLALTCRCLGSKRYNYFTCRTLGSKQYNDWSLVEDVAKQMLTKEQTNEERNALPRYDGESWIALLNELKLLRSPLTFDQYIGDKISYLYGDKSCVASTNYAPHDIMEDVWTGTPQTAICSSHVMRSGKHYATFTFKGSFQLCYFSPGVMRPIKDIAYCAKDVFGFRCFSPYHHTFLFHLWDGERTGRWGDSNVDCCAFAAYDGKSWSADWKRVESEKAQWSGMEGFELDDGKVGMLLDLDEGTLTVYKNGRKLGVMMRGLAGEYCWMATIIAQCDFPLRTQNIRIERDRVPTS